MSMMGKYLSTTFLSLVLVLVLVLVTILPAASADQNYCGTTPATDPYFPGYVNSALDRAIHELVSSKGGPVAIISYPDPATVGIKDWAYAVAYCYLEDKHECKVCLDDLLPYVTPCSVNSTGSAYYDQCRLEFALNSWNK
ncbi:hypothetical protein LINGRAHAP2_LOCUS29800 [Linum grandiflorum]